MQTTVLLSGGLDSAACLAYYRARRADLNALFVDFGHPSNRIEAIRSRQIADHFDVPIKQVTVRGGRDFSDGEIHGRNLFLICSAVMYCGYTGGLIAIGIHEGTPYFDTSSEFHTTADRLVSDMSAGLFRVDAPFIAMTKGEIFEYASTQGVPLDLTYSCERGSVPVCGECPSCQDREVLDASAKA